MRAKYVNLYCRCAKPATWVRSTQFSGDHPFCDACAQKENDFGQSDPSYFVWEKIPSDKIAPKHRTTVEGYEGSSKNLSKRIHLMRYDAVAEYYEHTAAELRRQAVGDQGRGRHKLAALLMEAADMAEQQRQKFSEIYNLCKLYIQEK